MFSFFLIYYPSNFRKLSLVFSIIQKSAQESAFEKENHFLTTRKLENICKVKLIMVLIMIISVLEQNYPFGNAY